MPYLYLIIRHLLIALPSERICHHDSSRDYSNCKAKYEKENRLKYLKASWPETRQREKNGSHIFRSPIITCSSIYSQKRNTWMPYFHDKVMKWQGSNFPLKMNNTSVRITCWRIFSRNNRSHDRYCFIYFIWEVRKTFNKIKILIFKPAAKIAEERNSNLSRTLDMFTLEVMILTLRLWSLWRH